MKLDSKYFDMIRIRPRRSAAGEEVRRASHAACQWRGCVEAGLHRAPKGRGSEGQFYLFCFAHVRQYNATYNYFDGMSNAEVEEHHKSSIYGHRPTWKVGVNSWAHGTSHGMSDPDLQRFADAHTWRAQSFHAWRARQARANAQETRRRLKPLERKALDALSLPEHAARDRIKTRFKELVKLHHPDLNGGDRGSEDKLREIIQAYNHLKQAGLV
jgi:hypothetical protein